MPEMRKVYNVKTGEEAVMYSVDAREAVQNNPGEWRYGTKAAPAVGEPPYNAILDTMSPGQTVQPKSAHRKGEPEEKPDGFGPEKGGPAVPMLSGETRMLVSPDDPNAPVLQPFARRGTKAEQVAASNADRPVPAPRKAARSTRKRRSTRRVARTPAPPAPAAPAPAEE